jgi:hypothetical protein
MKSADEDFVDSEYERYDYVFPEKDFESDVKQLCKRKFKHMLTLC